jgi:hypothetical protein
VREKEDRHQQRRLDGFLRPRAAAAAADIAPSAAAPEVIDLEVLTYCTAVFEIPSPHGLPDVGNPCAVSHHDAAYGHAFLIYSPVTRSVLPFCHANVMIWTKVEGSVQGSRGMMQAQATPSISEKRQLGVSMLCTAGYRAAQGAPPARALAGGSTHGRRGERGRRAQPAGRAQQPRGRDAGGAGCWPLPEQVWPQSRVVSCESYTSTSTYCAGTVKLNFCKLPALLERASCCQHVRKCQVCSACPRSTLLSRKEDPVGWLRHHKRKWRAAAAARKRRKLEAARDGDPSRQSAPVTEPRGRYFKP